MVLLAQLSYSQNIWEPISIPDSVSAKHINAEKEGVLFFVAGANNEPKGLYRSFDDGSTWQIIQVHPSSNSYPVNWTQYSPEKVLYVGMTSGIYRSFDDGDNFEKVLDGHIGFGLKFRPDNVIYFYGDEYFLISEDNGDTWDTLCTFEGFGYFYFKDIAFGLNGEIFAVGGTYTPWGGGFYRSFDNGITWENIGITDDHLQSICVNQDGKLIVGGFSGFQNYHSNNAGDTWVQGTEMSADVMQLYDNDKLITGGYINSNSGCWYSENWGESWINLIDTIINPQVQTISISPSNVIYAQTLKSSQNSYQLFKCTNPIVNIENIEAESNLRIHPNPIKDYVTISGIDFEKLKTFKIYNTNGQIVFSGLINRNRIDVSYLTTGVYLILFETDKDKYRRKIIIE